MSGHTARSTSRRFGDAHQARYVAGVVQGHGKVVAGWIDRKAAAPHEVAHQGHAAFAREIEIGGQEPVGNHGEGFVGMAALADDDAFDFELAGGLDLPQGDAGKLHVVVPQAVVDGVVGGELGGECPAHAGGGQHDGEGPGVLGPGKHLSGVMDQEHVGALDVPWRLDGDAGFFGHLVVDEIEAVAGAGGVHAGGGAGAKLHQRTGAVQFLRRDAHFLAEELAQLMRHQAVVAPMGQVCAQRRQRLQR